jgi:aminoglycoside phosphotransferase (APT) family kinase protein
MAATDVDRLTAWLDAQDLEVGQPLSLEPLTSGTSNLMMVMTRGGSEWVLRRPAKVAIDRANEGMRREFRILAALAGTPVPHPEVVALCDDHDVLGCTFFLMQRVAGVHPLPAPPPLDSEAGHAQISFAMVDALADLHSVDWRGAGLGDLGHPEQFHERQVSRWSRQLASYDGRPLVGVDDIMVWLDAHQPRAFDVSIMHGDYHLLNLLIAPDAPGRVTAVLDWETATIGDPLLDLAGFCELWCSITGAGWPDRTTLEHRYLQRRQIAALPDLSYYNVLYNFRLAVLLEGIYQRSLRDPERADRHDLGERVMWHVERGLAAISVADAG